MVTIEPIKLSGNWTQGYALDIHTIESTFIGYDEYGREAFETIRSGIGELLYRLKYKADRTVIEEIIDVVENYLANRWKIIGSIAAIMPVPPSKSRSFQPILEITRRLSSRLKIPFYDNILLKTKETPELKDVYDYGRRMELLKNAFKVESKILNGKSVLMLDDLYRSGATLHAITEVLYSQGNVQNVYVLTLTKTRSKA